MRPLIVLAALPLLLAGCGSDQFSRVSTGAGTGAGTGATIGLLGGPIGVGVGALIGAGAGAVTGAVTTPEQIDLGKPVWRDGNDTAAAQPAAPAQNGQAYGSQNYGNQDYGAGNGGAPTPLPQPYVPDRAGGAVTSQPLAAPRS